VLKHVHRKNRLNHTKKAAPASSCLGCFLAQICIFCAKFFDILCHSSTFISVLSVTIVTIVLTQVDPGTGCMIRAMEVEE
jgi:hypothetical protein